MKPHYPQRVAIDAFGRNGFRFAHLSHVGSLLVLPAGMFSWEPADAAALQPSDFAGVFEQQAAIDWLLIGTGPAMLKPPRAVVKAFEERALGFEYMSTASAVRTYNVVLAEGRRVAAALIAVEDSHA